jgi:hypothetical protein
MDMKRAAIGGEYRAVSNGCGEIFLKTGKNFRPG